MTNRRFEHTHELTLDRWVNSKPEILRFCDHRRRRLAPVIEPSSQNGRKCSLATRLHELDVCPRHQFLDTRCRPQVDELGEHIDHPRQGIDVVQLASFDQRSSDCPILRTDVVPREECVFASQSNRPDRALDGIGINLDAPIIEEPSEPFPVIEAIADRIGKLRTLGDLRQTFLQPGPQRIDDRLRSRRRWVRRTSGVPPRISVSMAYSLRMRTSASVAIGALPPT